MKLIIELVFSISSSIQYRDKNCYCTDSFITRCQGGNCQSMWREEENICCQEVDAVTVEELQAEPGCIVQHAGFEAVCLNVWVLQTGWLQYKQQYGSSAYEGPEHKKNRHITYRQLVRWCWGAFTFFCSELHMCPLPRAQPAGGGHDLYWFYLRR